VSQPSTSTWKKATIAIVTRSCGVAAAGSEPPPLGGQHGRHGGDDQIVYSPMATAFEPFDRFERDRAQIGITMKKISSSRGTWSGHNQPVV
jgi:hypothetical protein